MSDDRNFKPCLYHIFEGIVTVYDTINNQTVSRLRKGQIFKIDHDNMRRKIFKVHQDGRKEPETSKKTIGSTSMALETPCLLMMDLELLSIAFRNQIKIQNKIYKQDLLKFKMFHSLVDSELEHLARKAVKIEFFHNQVIVHEGQHPMDCFYLIVQGTVRAQKDQLKNQQEKNKGQ